MADQPSFAFACRDCFADEELRKWIDEQPNLETGTCAWCDTEDARLIPLEELGPLFRDVATMYTPNDGTHSFASGIDGDPIGYLFQDHWHTFSERIEEQDDLLETLCVDILEAGLNRKDDVDEPDYSGYFFTKNPSRTSAHEDWEERIGRLLSPPDEPPELIKAKLPPDHEPDWPDPLSFILSDLGTEYAPGSVLYRARIHGDRERKERFGTAELGAPPKDKATAGRANRAGEPVLYTTTDQETAIAEVRPWRNAPVAVARIEIPGRVRILDLTDLAPLGSPFFKESIGWMIGARAVLWQLHEDLKRPVTPHDADRQYRPTHYACDLMRDAGFDGVAFKSAMGPGTNVVLFNPEAGKVVQVDYVRVSTVGYTSEAETADDIDVDDFPY
jgi:hypothetical protein